MPIMKQKLIQDFFEADNCDKLIIKGQLDIETGIPILQEMIGNIIEDIQTMDEDTKKLLDEKIKQLNTANLERKNNIRKQFGEPDDGIDDRNIKRILLKEDHKKYKKTHKFYYWGNNLNGN